jgi:electron transfer flavoprotein beta subunit
MESSEKPLRCVVCVKQVPDTKQITGDAMKPDGTINRAALPAIFNPEDRCALEAALAVRDACGGTVSVVTMGLPSATAILRESLFCGADDAYLVTDRRAAASDTLATSYILSRAVAKLEPDLVFCGRQAIDGDTAQVGPQIAEKLGFALVTYVEELEVRGEYAFATRNLGDGVERVRTALPALLTVTSGFGELRPFNFRRVMTFKNAEPTVWSLDDIGADPARCGRAGSPTNVAKVQSVVLAGGDYREFTPDADGVGALVASLVQDHTLG